MFWEKEIQRRFSHRVLQTNWFGLRVFKRYESVGQQVQVFGSLGALLHLHLLLAAAPLCRQSEQRGVCVCTWAWAGGRGRGRTRGHRLRRRCLLFQVFVNGVPVLAAERIFWWPPQHQLHTGMAPGEGKETKQWHIGRFSSDGKYKTHQWHHEDIHRLSNSVWQDVTDSTLEAFLQTVGDHQHWSPRGGLNVQTFILIVILQCYSETHHYHAGAR